MMTTAKTPEEIPDELNPQFLFCVTATKLLTQIARGEIDPVELALRELANRGMHPDGYWVGFPPARKVAEERITERSKPSKRARKGSAEECQA